MKKIALAIISAALAGACIVGVAACGGSANFVANDATDLMPEEFGIAVKKGDTEMATAVNAVVDKWNEEGTIDKYVDYYVDLYTDSTTVAPQGLKVKWDLSSYTEELHMYTESGFAPMEFIDNTGYAVSDGAEGQGQYSITGLDVAIACEVAESLHCKLVIHDVAFDTIITNMNKQTGKTIAAAGISITDERKEEVDFSKAYFLSTIAIVCDENKTLTSLKDLDGLTVGAQEGTSGDLIASEAMTENGYTFTHGKGETVNIKLSGENTSVSTFKTYAAALAALKAGKIDVILMDKIPALLLLANA